jgi:hypothetical protein
MTALNPARRGSLLAATWLIGLGVIFLVRELSDLSWAQAWPMFVILAGVGAFVGRLVQGDLSLSGAPWALTGPIFWTVVGVILLMSTTGNLAEGPVELLAAWWPWFAVALGAWFIVGAFVARGPRSVETLTLPLERATGGSIRIRFGAGDLTTGTAASGRLVDGTFLGGVRHRRHGPGSVELEQDTSHGLPWLNHRSAWTIGLTSEVPLELRLEAGASRNVLDLRELTVRSLDLQTGASDTRILLPRAAGQTAVRAQAGAASLTFEIPDGVAAKIRTRVVLGSVQVDETRFPAVAGGFESPEYADATNRVDIDVQGGVGSLKIRSTTSSGAPARAVGDG